MVANGWFSLGAFISVVSGAFYLGVRINRIENELSYHSKLLKITIKGLDLKVDNEEITDSDLFSGGEN